MGKQKGVLSSIQLKDIYNDTIQEFMGIAVDNLKAEDIIVQFESVAFIEKNILGIRRLCVTRIAGRPFSVKAKNATDGSYVPRIRLFKGRRPK